VSAAFRPCALVPTYDNPRTLRRVVEEVRRHVADVVVVDDGSGPEAREVAASLEKDGIAAVVYRARNGGKGAAVRTGLEEAQRRGYTHALQVDADGQHDLADAQRLLGSARARPEALVAGQPIFDASAPRARRVGRALTLFWTRLETAGRFRGDPMCGFRVYPLPASLSVRWGDRMDGDVEILVRLVWRGVPVVCEPTRVRYLRAEEGGVSHFRMVRDNIRISWMHTRLTILSILARLRSPVRPP